MLKLQSPRQITKRARANKSLVNPQSHIQKKYFSLMLVPSYTSGKTRSIRIPYIAFYILFFTILTIAAVVLIFYLQSQFLRREAQNISASLEEVQEAYINLQEISEQEQNRLIEDGDALRSALNRERARSQEEQHQQRLTYLETLEAIQAYVEGLEEQLNQFEIYRQEILDQLSANAHIPPVRNMLNEMYQSQMHLLINLQELYEHSAARRERQYQQGYISLASTFSATNLSATPVEVAGDLLDYIELLELALETKIELYSQLEQQVRRVTPYIHNYPTLRPVNGRLTSGFGWRRNPWGGRGGEMHTGVDIAARTGTPIRATGGGTVVFAGWEGAFGNKVVIDHGFGIQTLYAHNSVNLVEVGQRVTRGETIARVGSTGRSTGPHVHYEVLVNGVAVDPANFFLE